MHGHFVEALMVSAPDHANRIPQLLHNERQSGAERLSSFCVSVVSIEKYAREQRFVARFPFRHYVLCKTLANMSTEARQFFNLSWGSASGCVFHHIRCVALTQRLDRS